MPPRKRECPEISGLAEPRFSSGQAANFDEGVRRFNAGLFWHAHESWEAAWLPMGDGPEDDAEIFIRALIQVASGIHLKRKGRHSGARSHFSKAGEKLDVVPDVFMGIDVVALRVFTRYQLERFDEDFSFFLRRS
jgi:predicted metal-dependent hydrolase